MQKGRFGFSVWLYPYISLWALFLEMNMIPFLVAGFVIAMEQDEWASKQCLHTIMICVYYSLYRFIISAGIAIPVLGTVFIVIDFIVDVVFFILVFVLGFGKLKKGESISMLGMGLVNNAYGYMQQYAPAPVYAAPQPAPQPAPQRPDSGVTPPAPQQQYAAPAPAPVYAAPPPPQPAPVYAAPPPPVPQFDSGITPPPAPAPVYAAPPPPPPQPVPTPMAAPEPPAPPPPPPGYTPPAGFIAPPPPPTV